MPRRKNLTPRKKLNFHVPTDLLEQLETLRRPRETDTDFYIRMLAASVEAHARRENGPEPKFEEDVLRVLAKHKIIPPRS